MCEVVCLLYACHTRLLLLRFVSGALDASRGKDRHSLRTARTPRSNCFGCGERAPLRLCSGSDHPSDVTAAL
eukprot:6201790-Pleurochrysis_carterae.AAC.1